MGTPFLLAKYAGYAPVRITVFSALNINKGANIEKYAQRLTLIVVSLNACGTESRMKE